MNVHKSSYARLLLVLLVSLAICLIAPRAGAQDNVVERANRFAGEYKVWAGIRNAPKDPGTISAAEVVGWQKVKS